MRFVCESLIRASAETVFAFHEAKDAFERLQPPWRMTVIVTLSNLLLLVRASCSAASEPVWQTLEAEHIACEPGRMFADKDVSNHSQPASARVDRS
jgi:ligand-binding SRPBCC domain-containing protein